MNWSNSIIRVCVLGVGFVGVGGSLSSQEKPPAPPSFNEDIAPVILRNCVSCHRKGGRAPFELTSHAALKEHGEAIAEVVRSGEMPPWLPDRDVSRFRHERGLQEEEIGLITRWIEAGMPEGEGTERLRFPEIPEGWQLGKPDLVIELPEGAEVGAKGKELFRNFVVPGLPADAEPRFIRAVEFDPGKGESTLFMSLREDTTGIGRRMDGFDESPGFGGILGAMVPGSPVISWQPGQVPEPLRDGLGWALSPGSDLILQLHLAVADGTTPVRPRIGLYFSEEPARAELETIHLGVAGFVLPAETKQARLRDQVPLKTAVRLYSIRPLAHGLATRFAAWAALPDGNKQPLLLIPEWDFRWRQEYHFAEPVTLPAGSVLHMEVFFDNSPQNQNDPDRPSQNVRWGPLTGNERADVWITAVPEKRADVGRLRTEVYLIDLRRQVAGYQSVLKEDPGNFEANSRIGHILVNQERPADAIPFLNAALKARPDDAVSWHNRGMARFFLKDLSGAKLNFGKALEFDPLYAPAYNGLAATLTLEGELEESIPHYRRYLELRPNDGDIWKNLAVVLTKLERLDEAESEYQKLIEAHPEVPGVLANFGALLSRQGKFDEGLKQLRRAIELDPRSGRIRLQTIEVLREAKRWEDAKKEVDAVLEIDPANEAALILLEEIKAEIKNAAKP